MQFCNLDQNNNVLMLPQNETYGRNSYCFSQQTDEDGKIETGVEICNDEEKLKSTNVRSLLYTIGKIVRKYYKKKSQFLSFFQE